MKKLLCIVLLAGFCFSGLSTVNAQNRSALGLSAELDPPEAAFQSQSALLQDFLQGTFGLLGGLTLADVNGTDVETELKAGFMLGAFYKSSLGMGPMSLTTSLVFSQRGYAVSDIKVLLNYLDLSFMLAYQFPTQGLINPYLGVGPYLGLLLSAHDKFEDQKQKIEDANGVDLGAFLEAGVLYQSVMVSIFMSQGLNKIYDNEFSDHKNFWIGFKVGLQI